MGNSKHCKDVYLCFAGLSNCQRAFNNEFSVSCANMHHIIISRLYETGRTATRTPFPSTSFQFSSIIFHYINYSFRIPSTHFPSYIFAAAVIVPMHSPNPTKAPSTPPQTPVIVIASPSSQNFLTSPFLNLIGDLPPRVCSNRLPRSVVSRPLIVPEANNRLPTARTYPIAFPPINNSVSSHAWQRKRLSCSASSCHRVLSYRRSTSRDC